MSAADPPILVVDDDPEVREALRDSLEIEGYSVVDVGSGADALDYLGLHPRPLLVLLDWNMAPMDASEFMRELAKSPGFAGIPVVLITADARAQQKATTANFVDYLDKPLNLHKLFTIIERYAVS